MHARLRHAAFAVAAATAVVAAGLSPATGSTGGEVERASVAPSAATVLTSTALRSTPVAFPSSPRGLPAPVSQPAEVEEASGWSPQVSCNPVPMRGVRNLRALALRTYGRGHDGGISRSCASGGSSEHKEGRAWDWMLDVNDRRERRTAGDFLAWLTQNRGRQARRLGVMYVIYNGKMWRSYEPGWGTYSGSSPHTDHIHLSFSWAGARGRTSFWTGRVAGIDHGPCRVFRGQPAVISRRANWQPCPDPKPLVKRSSRPVVVYGTSGSRPVRAAQRLLGLARTGDFGRRTWRTVKVYQREHDLAVTGVLDKPTWASLAPASVRWSLTRGCRPVRAARYAARRWSDVRLQRGSAGRPVAFVQTALRMRHANRNGLIGNRTARALRRFKSANGMVGNATVNRRVWRALASR